MEGITTGADPEIGLVIVDCSRRILSLYLSIIFYSENTKPNADPVLVLVIDIVEQVVRQSARSDRKQFYLLQQRSHVHPELLVKGPGAVLGAQRIAGKQEG